MIPIEVFDKKFSSLIEEVKSMNDVSVHPTIEDIFNRAREDLISDMFFHCVMNNKPQMHTRKISASEAKQRVAYKRILREKGYDAISIMNLSTPSLERLCDQADKKTA